LTRRNLLASAVSVFCGAVPFRHLNVAAEPVVPRSQWYPVGHSAELLQLNLVGSTWHPATSSRAAANESTAVFCIGRFPPEEVVSIRIFPPPPHRTVWEGSRGRRRRRGSRAGRGLRHGGTRDRMVGRSLRRRDVRHHGRRRLRRRGRARAARRLRGSRCRRSRWLAATGHFRRRRIAHAGRRRLPRLLFLREELVDLLERLLHRGGGLRIRVLAQVRAVELLRLVVLPGLPVRLGDVEEQRRQW